jgi:hypothetical protein
MSNIRTEMTVLSRHEGEWVGIYTVVDLTGKILDTHQSHISCRFPEDQSYPYYQINRYSWADGKKEEYHLPGTYHDKKLWIENEHFQGKAWEVDNATIIINFNYDSQQDSYLYEMIQISPCNNYRARTWHWFKNHQIYKRTLIQEERFK